MGWLLQMWNIWFALGHQLQIFIGDMYFPVCWSEFFHSHSVRCRALGAAIMSCSSSKISLRVWRQFVCLMSILVGGFAAAGGTKLLTHWDRGHSKGSSPSLYLWRSSLCMTIHACDQIWWLWRNFKQLWGMNKHSLSSVHKINQIRRWGSWMLLEVFDVWARGWMQLEMQLGIQFLSPHPLIWKTSDFSLKFVSRENKNYLELYRMLVGVDLFSVFERHHGKEKKCEVNR
jgi:hypothetical protein